MRKAILQNLALWSPQQGDDHSACETVSRIAVPNRSDACQFSESPPCQSCWLRPTSACRAWLKHDVRLDGASAQMERAHQWGPRAAGTGNSALVAACASIAEPRVFRGHRRASAAMVGFAMSDITAGPISDVTLTPVEEVTAADMVAVGRAEGVDPARVEVAGPAGNATAIRQRASAVSMRMASQQPTASARTMFGLSAVQAVLHRTRSVRCRPYNSLARENSEPSD